MSAHFDFDFDTSNTYVNYIMDEDVNSELLEFRMKHNEIRITHLENQLSILCTKISELTTVVQLQQQQLSILKWVAMVSCAAIIGNLVKGLM